MTNKLIDNRLDKPQFDKSILKNKEPVSSQALGKELEQAKRRNEHERNERLQNAINDLKINVYRFGWFVVMIPGIIWLFACWVNAYEVKAGMEYVLKTIATLGIGALLGKVLEK